MSAISSDSNINLNEFLPEDVLWDIFTLISLNEQISANQRLRNITSGSHVCQAWRNVIVNCAPIWGRLVVIDSERGETRKPMLNEIIRRSGSSLVWIECSCTSNTYGTHKRDLIMVILPGLWARIQRIRIFGLEARHTNIFTEPAPILERVHIEGLPIRYSLTQPKSTLS